MAAMQVTEEEIIQEVEYRFKSAVGPYELYDLIGAHQFCVMVKTGLREDDTMLDFGCGCLRGGKFFISYLKENGYTGIEPNKDLVDYGIHEELTKSLYAKKRPRFYYWDDFIFAERLTHLPRYNFVLAQSILTHAGPDIARLIMSESYKVLNPGGKFVATFFDGLSNTAEYGWLGNGVAKYREDYLREVVIDLGYKYMVTQELGHPMGQTWLVAKKS